ncbi:DUF5995 family protein [Streptomyces angustmyceticus]|uniref:Uncharacterized protein n=1 Tax=Streptomyces angustmyceticus TaxID=285578 RepID=A0A5J4LJ85_9ACTN|nr:DUF5995 family protein [Streptomyces angustmyceticus]UAL70239.1 DUF5995 family protein [Streptomyces angustmyceticus]GES34247.1 hypothetical protein San01_67350 [Streptomyces angustmyceticus]
MTTTQRPSRPDRPSPATGPAARPPTGPHTATGTESATAPGVAGVLARMRALAAALPAEDGVAVFNGVYLAVTEAVAHRLGDGGFQDPATAGELDLRFARRYFDAVDATAGGRRPPACWRPLFQLRRHPGVRPLQFALAGINAHIGHDLALAVLDTCRALECEPAALEADFDRVGALLTSLEERIREQLMPGPDVLDVADPLTHLIGSWSLDKARDGAWVAARALWSVRRLPEVAEELTERLDAGVGLVGRMLLTPLPG